MAEIDYRRARHNMVENQIRCGKVLDPRIIDLFETMPREAFVPESLRSLAYMEGHVPLPCDQQMLNPLQEAAIMQALQLTGEEKVLEVGSGSGFLTALLAMQAREVVSCEIHEELARMASENLRRQGITNARVVHVNAMNPEELTKSGISGPFDAVVLGAALREIPEHIQNLVTDDGVIMAFLGQNPVVSLVKMKRIGNRWHQTTIMETLLDDMEGLPETRELVF